MASERIRWWSVFAMAWGFVFLAWGLEVKDVASEWRVLLLGLGMFGFGWCSR